MRVGVGVEAEKSQRGMGGYREGLYHMMGK